MIFFNFPDVQRGPTGAGLGGHRHRNILRRQSSIPNARARRQRQVQQVQHDVERKQQTHDHRDLGTADRHGHRYVQLDLIFLRDLNFCDVQFSHVSRQDL